MAHFGCAGVTVSGQAEIRHVLEHSHRRLGTQEVAATPRCRPARSTSKAQPLPQLTPREGRRVSAGGVAAPHIHPVGLSEGFDEGRLACSVLADEERDRRAELEPGSRQLRNGGNRPRPRRAFGRCPVVGALAGTVDEGASHDHRVVVQSRLMTCPM